MSAIVCASLTGSLASGATGRPWATSQNGQRRVQMAPRIINVAVPWLKHSARFGQEASSQTECRPFLRIAALMPWIRVESAGSLIFIHSGLRSRASRSVATFLTGIRAILSASRYLTPRSITMGLLIACVFQLRITRESVSIQGNVVFINYF